MTALALIKSAIDKLTTVGFLDLCILATASIFVAFTLISLQVI